MYKIIYAINRLTFLLNFIFFACSAAFSLPAQQEIDSLLSVVNHSQRDTITAWQYNQISKLYRKVNYEEAMKYAEMAFHLSDSINYKRGKAFGCYNIGYAIYYIESIEKSLEWYLKALDEFIALEDQTLTAGMYNDIGYIYSDMGKIEKSIHFYRKSLKIFEEMKDTAGISAACNNIGKKFLDLKNNDHALEYFEKSLKLRKNLELYQGTSIIFINTASIYFEKGDTSKALAYAHKAADVAKKNNYLLGISAAYSNLGILYQSIDNPERALEYYQKQLEIVIKLGNKEGIAKSQIEIGNLYFHIGNNAKAIELGKKAYQTAYDMKFPRRELSAASLLSKSYAKTGNYQQAYQFHLIYSQLYDSTLNADISRQIQEFEAKYQNEKKKRKITDLQKEQKIKEVKISEQEAQRKLLLAGIGLVLLMVLIVFFAFIQKRKSNRELNAQNKKIAAQRDEISNQRTHLEAKNKEVTDSILYAERIQFALLKPEKQVAGHLPPHFIYFRPKDIVSGDFYWTLEKEHYVYIAAVDCTGHGVPGAFMSMLGIAYLNEINAIKDRLLPAEILNRLRDKIIKELNQTGKMQDTKDGMDMSLICYDLKNKILEFSGANNSLFIINRNTSLSGVDNSLTGQNDYYLHEIKADKQPIGYSDYPLPFTNHQIPLGENDRFYLFTDGYPDQFGGPKGKKFKYKAFKELLISIQNQSMEEQKSSLNEAFEQWKAWPDHSDGGVVRRTEQIDDVCVIGVQV